MNKNSKIYVAGHTGLVGSAVVRKLKSEGYSNLIYSKRPETDLREQTATELFFKKNKPEFVFLSAAKVGGIAANNTYRADFILDNLQIQNNVIQQCFKHDVKKLIFLGSSCIYPKNCPQPIKEEYLLNNILEYTNEPYAIAKIAGIKLCESFNLQYGTNFISVMPTNLYGHNDNFDLEKSHVLPALIRKMHLAKALSEQNFEAVKKDISQLPIAGIGSESKPEEIISTLSRFGIKQDELQIWGSGKPRREFLHADDLADALVHIAETLNFEDILKSQFGSTADQLNEAKTEIRNTHINLGTGKDISISELAELIKETVGFPGNISYDTTKPDGTFRKLLDVSLSESLGIKPKIPLREGIKKTYSDYLEEQI